MESNWLEIVSEVVSGPRRRDYGHPLTNFLRICIMWSMTVGRPISPRQFVLMMVQMKTARELHNNKLDNWIDMLGYEVGLETCYERLKDFGLSMESLEDPTDGLAAMGTVLQWSIDRDERDKQELDTD